jgi:hypothetical protein
MDCDTPLGAPVQVGVLNGSVLKRRHGEVARTEVIDMDCDTPLGAPVQVGVLNGSVPKRRSWGREARPKAPSYGGVSVSRRPLCPFVLGDSVPMVC